MKWCLTSVSGVTRLRTETSQSGNPAVSSSLAETLGWPVCQGQAWGHHALESSVLLPKAVTGPCARCKPAFPGDAALTVSGVRSHWWLCCTQVNAELCFQMLFALHSSCWAGWQQQAQLGQGRQSSAVSLFVGQDEGRAGTAGSGKGAVAARATWGCATHICCSLSADPGTCCSLGSPAAGKPASSPAVPAAQRGCSSPVTQT